MSEWLVFSQESHAKTAVNQIDVRLKVPVNGRNAGSGKVEDGKVGTETWAVPARRLDGKWCFPRHPQHDPTRPFDVETFSPAWFPQDTA